LIYELRPGSEWLLAWEDLDATTLQTDNDYNDMFVKIKAVPEPISSVLFLLGGGVFAAKKRNKKKSKSN